MACKFEIPKTRGRVRSAHMERTRAHKRLPGTLRFDVGREATRDFVTPPLNIIWSGLRQPRVASPMAPAACIALGYAVRAGGRLREEIQMFGRLGWTRGGGQENLQAWSSSFSERQKGVLSNRSSASTIWQPWQPLSCSSQPLRGT